MRLASRSGVDTLDLVPGASEVEYLPSVSFRARLEAGGNAGTNDEVWIELSRLDAFACALAEVAQGGRGRASLAALSPGELELEARRGEDGVAVRAVVGRCTHGPDGRVREESLVVDLAVTDEAAKAFADACRALVRERSPT